MIWRSSIISSFLFALVAAPSICRAQDYPNHVINIVVPLGPAGGVDTMGRFIAQKLSERFGVAVVVENKPGAGTVLAGNYVAKSPPDGYTLLIATTTTLATAPLINQSVAYDPLKDFEPLAMLVASGFFLETNPKSKIHGVGDLVQAAKDRPGKLTFGSSGIGTAGHLFMELFMKQTGTQLIHVPYQSSPQVTNDIVGGNIDVAFVDSESSLEMGAAGVVRLLANTAPVRHPLAPDVPTVAEAGAPGFSALSWITLVAPSKTPAPIVSKLRDALRPILASREFQDFIHRAGPVKLDYATPDSLKEFFKAERRKTEVALQGTGLLLK